MDETTEGLTGAGAMSKQTMREFEALCQAGAAADPGGNSGTAGGASQAVFARYLYVTTGLVSQVGTRRPADREID